MKMSSGCIRWPFMGKYKNKHKYEEKKKNPELPYHIQEEILARIPSEILYYKFRFICKSWHKTISSNGHYFMTQVLRHAKKELLIQYENRIISLQIDEKGLGFTCDYFDDTSALGLVVSSCNGLLVITGFWSKFAVVNFVTGGLVTVRVNPSLCSHNRPGRCSIAIGYVPCTNQYKLVHTFADDFEIFDSGYGKKDWRVIPGPFKKHPSERPAKMKESGWTNPVSINGEVLHYNVCSDEFIVSMSVSDEVIGRTRLPNCTSKIAGHHYDMLEMNGHLAVIYRVSGVELGFWILQDFHSQVWINKHNINVESIENKVFQSLSNLEPVASLRNGEVLVFKIIDRANELCLYDMKERNLKKWMSFEEKNLGVVTYSRSLVTWKSTNLLKIRKKFIKTNSEEKMEMKIPSRVTG